jgi:hypothetical protein
MVSMSRCERARWKPEERTVRATGKREEESGPQVCTQPGIVIAVHTDMC